MDAVTGSPLRWLVIGGLIGLLGGFAIAWGLWRPQEVTETPAPEERRPDGSVVIERRPDPTAKPDLAIPRGTTLERVVRLTIQPTPIVLPGVSRGTPGADTLPRCACAPVELELAIVREKSGARRVVARAGRDSILSAIDIPVEAAVPPRRLRWSAGPEYDLTAKAWGGFVERDFDRLSFIPLPLRAGISLTPATATSAQRVGFRIGLRF